MYKSALLQFADLDMPMSAINGTNLVLAHAGYNRPAVYREFVVQTV